MGNQISTICDSLWPMNTMSMKRDVPTNSDEEMKKELKGQLMNLNMYEKDMNIDDMVQRLEIIAESKKIAEKDNFYSKNTSGSPSDMIESSVPSPSSSNVDNRMSTTLSTKSINQEFTNSETSHELYNKKWCQLNDNQLSDEKIFSPPKASVNTNAADVARARKVEESANSRDLQSANPVCDANVTRYNQTTQGTRSSFNSSRHLNVWDFKKLPNDVPLKSRCIRKPQKKFDIFDGILKIPEEILAEKRAYLTEMANLAHCWKTQLVCNEFSWGPPIKVGIANGSLDKYPIHEEISDDPALLPVHQSRVITREVGASGYSLRHTVKKITDINEFSDSDNDFDDKNKRKKTSKISLNKLNTPRQYQPEKHANLGGSEEVTKNTKSSIDVADNNVDKMNSMPNDRKRAKSTTPDYLQQLYPRRIVPPVISTAPKTKRKKNPSAPRSKKRSVSPEYNSDENDPTNKTTGLTEHQIQHLLTDNEEPEVVDIPVQPTKRLNQSVEYLKRLKFEDDEKKRNLENEAQLLADEETRIKVERVQKRIKERNAKLQEQETQEKSKRECENRYRNLINISRSQGHVTGTFQTRTELQSEEPPRRSIYYTPGVARTKIPSPPSNEEPDMFDDEECERMKSNNSVGQSECPICGKLFSLTEIENHAANCDDFVQDKSTEDDRININASTSNNSSVLQTYSCKICKFVTHNKYLYDRHFSDCVKSLTDEGNKSPNASSNQSNRKFTLTIRDSDVESDQTENLSPLTNKKKMPKPQSRKRKR